MLREKCKWQRVRNQHYDKGLRLYTLRLVVMTRDVSSPVSRTSTTSSYA